jgi:cysteine synthase
MEPELAPHRRLKSLEEIRQAFAPIVEANRQSEALMATLADELAVDAKVACSMCPLAVTGHCDGHAFYLRERHGEYRVTVSVEPSAVDLWTSGDEVPYVDVATGSDVDIYDADEHPYSAALRVAVTAVRDWLRRTGCDHAPRGDRAFCPDCGERAPTSP